MSTTDVLTPYTEQCHKNTYKMDEINSEEFVKMLISADREIFNGWENSKGLFAKKVMEKIEDIANIASDFLRGDESNLIVLAGSGTSGRLAFVISRYFNKELKKHNMALKYDYCISGGDPSLFFSQEAFEDNPFAGVEDLKNVTEGKSKVLYVGISCGMSAPYVAGQLDYCLQNLDRFIPVLIGFNPISLSRVLKIQDWDKTFRSVSEDMNNAGRNKKAFIINPIIGPEPLSGSTRMKSGTATKIILELMFTKAHIQHIHQQEMKSIVPLLQCYQLTHETLANNSESLAKLLTTAGNCLRLGGRLYYISEGMVGIYSLIDASECVPTFGADPSQVQAYIQGGYEFYQNKQGDLSTIIKIAISDFIKDKIPNLTRHDFVLFINAGAQFKTIKPLLPTTIKCVSLNIYQQGISFPCSSAGNIPQNTEEAEMYDFLLPDFSCYTTLLSSQIISKALPMFISFVVKCCCNILSTGAFVKAGKVYHNYMVDVKLSNIKLFHRAVNIVEKILKCDKGKATKCVLRSVYEDEEIIETEISEHVKKATTMKKVVPIALIIGQKNCTVKTAKQLLEKCHTVTEAVQINDK